jgi:hypothetical protein
MRKVVFLAWVAAAALLPVTRAAADPADEAAAKQIGQRLYDSGRLRNFRIGVKYDDGVAWLSGTVASAAQRDEAQRMTEQMPGVSHVVNRLEIAGAPASNGGNVAAAFNEDFNAAAPPMHRSAQAQFAAANQNMTAAGPAQNIPGNMPVPAGRMQAMPVPTSFGGAGMNAAYDAPAQNAIAYSGAGAVPMPAAYVPGGSARAVSYDNAQMPGYAWPSYAAYPNYAALTYPQQYSPTAWPYIGPFYPYPQVPLAWRKVSLEWDDGWWFLDFSAHNSSH